MAATWGTNVLGANSWASETVAASLTGFSVTSSLGTLAYAGSVEGWVEMPGVIITGVKMQLM